MKYNPDYHGNVVRNLKREFKERYEKELTLADEEIFRVHQEMFCVESDNPDDRELPIYEALEDEQNDLGKYS